MYFDNMYKINSIKRIKNENMKIDNYILEQQSCILCSEEKRKDW